MFSSQFNFTRTFLNSFVVSFLGLTHLSYLLVNFLPGVSIDWLYVCRVCFVFFPFSPPKKWTSSIKKKLSDVRSDERLTSDVRRQTSAPPHLMTSRQVRQLSERLRVKTRGGEILVDKERVNGIPFFLSLPPPLCLSWVSTEILVLPTFRWHRSVSWETICCLLWRDKTRSKQKLRCLFIMNQ